LVNRAIKVIFLLDILLVTLSTILLMSFEQDNFDVLWYVGFRLPGHTPQHLVGRLPNGVEWKTNKTSFIEGWLTFIVLYNNFVPISMYVTMEMITYIHIHMVNEDLELYHAESDTPAKARSNNVTDLGQIEYVFSDKTGTLTQNVMKFKRCSVDGLVYGAPVLDTPGNRNLKYVGLGSVPDAATQSQNLDFFLKILALCHTVVVERDQSASSSSAPAPPPAPPSPPPVAVVAELSPGQGRKSISGSPKQPQGAGSKPTGAGAIVAAALPPMDYQVRRTRRTGAGLSLGGMWLGDDRDCP
jgi:magnesium-transporting ATPase (P-type)